jgi:tripeptidyl-peptidase I
MKLGLQGTTLVFSSGDGGVAGGHGGDCLGSKQDIFNAQIGAACPYVTTVGSTFIPEGSVPGDDEQATSRFASGGGFSNIWTIPPYQQSAIEK